MVNRRKVLSRRQVRLKAAGVSERRFARRRDGELDLLGPGPGKHLGRQHPVEPDCLADGIGNAAAVGNLGGQELEVPPLLIAVYLKLILPGHETVAYGERPEGRRIRRIGRTQIERRAWSRRRRRHAGS